MSNELKPKDLGRAIVMAQHFCDEENCTLCRGALAQAMGMWGEWQRATPAESPSATDTTGLRELLYEYRCQYCQDVEGDGLPLLDMFATAMEDDDIGNAKRELELLADFLAAQPDSSAKGE